MPHPCSKDPKYSMMNFEKPPSLFRRLAVITYDLLLLIAVLFFATLILLPFQEGNSFQPNSWLYPLYLLAISFFFYAWFWTTGGQTLGLMAWKLRVANVDGSDIGWKKSLIRFSCAIFSWALFGLGFFWIFFNKERLSWHDIASKSRLVWKQSK
tara:strand:+ start:46525 stop:46986 length:462 start_codon:yes stop_codon:yes gene_type:complete